MQNRLITIDTDFIFESLSLSLSVRVGSFGNYVFDSSGLKLNFVFGRRTLDDAHVLFCLTHLITWRTLRTFSRDGERQTHTCSNIFRLAQCLPHFLTRHTHAVVVRPTVCIVSSTVARLLRRWRRAVARASQHAVDILSRNSERDQRTVMCRHTTTPHDKRAATQTTTPPHHDVTHAQWEPHVLLGETSQQALLGLVLPAFSRV